MVCPSCGKKLAETDARCGSCGSALSPPEPPSDESLPRASTVAAPGTPEQPPRKSRKAIASLVLGLLSFAFLVWLIVVLFGNTSERVYLGLLFAGLLAGLLAVIVGHLAKASIRRNQGRPLGKVMAAGGIALGYLGLAAWMLLATVTLLIPVLFSNSLRQMGPGSAAGSLRFINTAATTYASTYKHGFPPTLAALGPPDMGKTNSRVKYSENTAGLIDEVLASGTKSGYHFTYIPGPSDSTGKIQTYAVHADPVNIHAAENIHLFTDQTNVIRVQKDKEANQNSPRIPD